MHMRYGKTVFPKPLFCTTWHLLHHVNNSRTPDLVLFVWGAGIIFRYLLLRDDVCLYEYQCDKTEQKEYRLQTGLATCKQGLLALEEKPLKETDHARN